MMASTDWCYEVSAIADAQALSRIVNFFTQLDILPSSVHAHDRGDTLDISISVPAWDTSKLEIIAEKMRSLVLIRSVAISATPPLSAPAGHGR